MARKMTTFKGYTIQEATVGDLFPILDLADTDPKKFQFELIKITVSKDGEKIGDKINDFTLPEYLELLQEVMKITTVQGN